MRRVVIKPAKLFAALILIGATSARAQSLPTLDEATALVKKAIDGTELKTPGASPFHLVATIRYTLDDKSTDGTYEILYAAPDRYRVELRLGAIGETDIALGDKYYTLRTTPIMSLPFWSLKMFIWQPGYLYLGIAPNANRVYTSTVGTEGRTCVDAESDKAATKQICFDPTSNAVVSIHVTAQLPKGTPKGVAFESDLADFVDLGTIRYPRHLVRKFVTETIEATVETLMPVNAFADSVFAPPDKAEVHDWCASPVHEGQAKLPAPTRPTESWLRMQNLVAYYFLVGTDGRVKKKMLLHSSGNAGLDVLSSLPFEKGKPSVHTCNGKPIEYETVHVSGLLDRPLIAAREHTYSGCRSRRGAHSIRKSCWITQEHVCRQRRDRPHSRVGHQQP